jgi:hypothetical protein
MHSASTPHNVIQHVEQTLSPDHQEMLLAAATHQGQGQGSGSDHVHSSTTKSYLLQPTEDFEGA